MRTIELRSLSFPELETRRVEIQTTKGGEETQDFLAILQSVQKDNFPQDEIQSRPESQPPKREESLISEDTEAAILKDASEFSPEDEISEEPSSEEREVPGTEVQEKPKVVGEQKLQITQSVEAHLSEEEISPTAFSETNATFQSGLSLVSLLNPKSEIEHQEEIFQNRVISSPKESLLPPKEKFSSEEKKETNDLLKSMFVEKNSKQKQEEKPQQSKTIDESYKTPIASARLVVDEWRQQVQGTQKVEDGVKVSAFIQNMVGEFPELGEKKTKNNSRTQKTSENNLEKRTEDSQLLKINSKETLQNIQKNQGIETVSITEKLRRTELNMKKEKEQASTPVPQQASEPLILSKERTNTNLQTSEPKVKTSEPKAEVRAARAQEAPRNFQEIVKAARFQIVENGKNSAEILLQPKELGRVTLFVSEENNRLEGKIFVETDSAKIMILSELQNLKADLKTSGLELFELTVDIRDENPMRFSSSEEKKNGDDGAGYKGRGNDGVDTEIEVNPPNAASDRILDIKV